MTAPDTTDARRLLAELDGKALDEAANTYLLGVLELDLPDEVRQRWRDGFAEDEERLQAEQAVATLTEAERAELLRLSMLSTLDDQPDTAPLFVAAVEQAGRSMFVVEVAVISLSAALLMREWYRKGRAHTTRRRETRMPDGTKIIEEEEVTYLADGPLAKLLTTLGMSPSGPVP